MKILLVAGALTLAVLLTTTGGQPAQPLDDLRWQSGQPYALAPYEAAKIGRPEAVIHQVAIASSTWERR